jgi:hypothetical protein
MNSPAPNNPGAASAMSPPTEYMNELELELELEATSEDDIGAGDKPSAFSPPRPWRI